MKQEEYRSLLGQLPIKSPTAKDMARLCPHLTQDQAVKAFNSGDGFVACPPLRVRDGFQILAHRKEWIEKIQIQGRLNGVPSDFTGSKNHPAVLKWSYASRVPGTHQHIKEALKFAEDNWSEMLITDDWKSVISFYIQDPTDLVNDLYHTDYPRTKAVLYVTLNRDLNEINNDHSKPESILLNDAISQMTLDFIEWHELMGKRGGFEKSNCAYCGAGLGRSGCTGCGYRFHDDQYRSGWNTPLPPKMVAFLRKSGHKFQVDPKVAQEKERQRWEKGRKEYEEMMKQRERK